MHICVFAYIEFYVYEKNDLRVFFNKKEKKVFEKHMFVAYICLCIFMFSIHCIYLLLIAMHELRGSFFEA